MGFLGSLLNSLIGGGKCPICGTPGAQTEGSKVRCLNPFCSNFDPSMKQGQPGAPQQPSQPGQPQGQPPGWRSGGSAGPTVSIQYKNFQDQSKTFTADAASLRRVKNHIIAKVAPKGQTITLSRSRIQNLKEVESHMPQRVAPDQDWPSPKERQVMGYHKKNGTTSPLYEKIRAKYPNW
jgi:hypothetical protein